MLRQHGLSRCHGIRRGLSQPDARLRYAGLPNSSIIARLTRTNLYEGFAATASGKQEVRMQLYAHASSVVAEAANARMDANSFIQKAKRRDVSYTNSYTTPRKRTNPALSGRDLGSNRWWTV